MEADHGTQVLARAGKFQRGLTAETEADGAKLIGINAVIPAQHVETCGASAAHLVDVARQFADISGGLLHVCNWAAEHVCRERDIPHVCEHFWLLHRIDLPPSEWPNFYFRDGHEGGIEWQGSASRDVA